MMDDRMMDDGNKVEIFDVAQRTASMLFGRFFMPDHVSRTCVMRATFEGLMHRPRDWLLLPIEEGGRRRVCGLGGL